MTNPERTAPPAIPTVPLPVQPARDRTVKHGEEAHEAAERKTRSEPDKDSIQDQLVSGPLVLARVGDSIEWVEYDPTRDPVTDAMAWVDGYEHRLSVAERVRVNPKNTEAEYRSMLNWADDVRRDRQHEAFEVLLDRIRQHPSPPYSPEVLLAEYRGLLNISLRDRLWDRFCERMLGWLDRVNTYLSIGELDAPPESNGDFGIPRGKPGGYTAKELRDEAEAAGASVSSTTFTRIRKASGVAGPQKGTAGQTFKYSNTVIRKLAKVARDGGTLGNRQHVFRNGRAISGAWLGLIGQEIEIK